MTLVHLYSVEMKVLFHRDAFNATSARRDRWDPTPSDMTNTLHTEMRRARARGAWEMTLTVGPVLESVLRETLSHSGAQHVRDALSCYDSITIELERFMIHDFN